MIDLVMSQHPQAKVIAIEETDDEPVFLLCYAPRYDNIKPH